MCIYSQAVQNQHKANHQIVYEEIIEISKKTTRQSLEIAHRLEISEIEKF